MIARVAFLSPPCVWRKYSRFFLALFWISGLLSGTYFFHHVCSLHSSLMYGINSFSGSIIGSLMAVFLPFFISAFAITVSWPVLILPVSFFKSFSFAFSAAYIDFCFGSAGWMASLLLLSGQWLLLPFLYCFWRMHISGELGIQRWEIGCALLLFLGFGMVQFYIFMPLLECLIVY